MDSSILGIVRRKSRHCKVSLSTLATIVPYLVTDMRGRYLNVKQFELLEIFFQFLLAQALPGSGLHRLGGRAGLFGLLVDRHLQLLF